MSKQQGMTLPKYRLLTREEHLGLEKEFVEYLILNGIAAEDWVKLKTEEQEKAENILIRFSDVVFESILRKARFIELRGKSFLHIYQCLPQEWVLVAMEMPETEGVDFRDAQFLQRASQEAPEGLKVFTITKKYSEPREMELFQLLQKGGVLTDDRLFKTLCLMLP